MKKYIIIALSVLSLLACKPEPKASIIKGKISPKAENLLVIAQVSSTHHRDTVMIESDGSFEYTSYMTEADQISFYFFNDQPFVKSCYVVAGGKLEMRIIDGEATFLGDTQKECEYLNLPYHNYEYQNEEGTPISYLDFQKQVAEHQAFLRGKLDGTLPAFANQKGKEIDLLSFNNSFMYANSMWYRGFAPEEDSDFVKFIESIDINDEKYYKNSDYTYRPLDEIAKFWMKYRADLYGGDDYYTSKFHFLRDKMTNLELRTKIVDEEMDLLLAIGGNEYLETSFAAYREISDTSALFKKNEQIYESLKKLLPGTPATDFLMKEPNGTEVQFLDVVGKGKVVYIDFWATWCGPCCLQIPFVEKLVEEYKNNSEIEFISISLDKDVDKWLAKLEVDKPTWRQYIIPDNFDSPFAKQYNVRGIPRFMVFDKEGKIINISAPVPSQPTTKLYLDQILERY